MDSLENFLVIKKKKIKKTTEVGRKCPELQLSYLSIVKGADVKAT